MSKNGKITNLIKPDEPITLSTGYRAILRPAPALLVEEAGNDIDYPSVPRQAVDGVERENPNDPDYIKACNKVTREKQQASLDVMVLFTVNLVDGLPEDESWLANLRYLEKLKRIDLSKYNLNDLDDKTFVFKRYIACGNDDLILIAQLNGISQEDVDTFKASFQGAEARSTN